MDETPVTENRVLHSRINDIEDDVQGFGQQLASVKSEVAHISLGLDKLAKGFETFASSVSVSNKPNWQTIAAWAGLVIGIMGSLGYLYQQPLQQRLDKIDGDMPAIRRATAEYQVKFDGIEREIVLREELQQERLKRLDEKIDLYTKLSIYEREHQRSWQLPPTRLPSAPLGKKFMSEILDAPSSP